MQIINVSIHQREQRGWQSELAGGFLPHVASQLPLFRSASSQAVWGSDTYYRLLGIKLRFTGLSKPVALCM